jgi:ABC-type transport system substrate-binding protein
MRKFYVLLALLMVVSFVLTACAQPTAAPVVVEPPTTTEPVVQPTAEVIEVILNPYLGSNKLDGNGIPPTFFDDVHVRKAFGYCFEYQTIIDDVYMGEAVQSKTLSLPGMAGYDPNFPAYEYDLAKCEEEFKLADVDKDGIPAGEDPDDIWEMGFRFQMLYNTGNTTREIYTEIVSANVRAVNPKFTVETLGLPWPSYLAAQRAHKVPMMTGGWLEDIHDPHNWYQPYTTGTYGARQNMPADLKAQFKALLDEGVAAIDFDTRSAIYTEFNQLYYDLAVGIPLVLSTSHAYEQRWVEGRITNPIFSGIYYYTISKAAGAKNPDVFTVMTTGSPDTLDPALSYDTASGEIVQNVYETLVFYDGESTSEMVAQLATEWTVSEDGTVWTFTIRPDVKFHEGGDLTPEDVAYSFQRGLLQGGYSSPQWLLAEPFFGVGVDDITGLVDDFASADDREALMANDPAVLVAACETVKSKIVADDAAGTVTMTLAQPWGPFLPTIANGWGSVMDKEWVIENGGWDGTCDTWQNFYGMVSADDPFTTIANGTGPFKLDYWNQGVEVSLVRNEEYWNTPAALAQVLIMDVSEFGTRFAALQAGDADIIAVPAEYRTQVDPLVGVAKFYDAQTNTYLDEENVCAVDTSLLGKDRFTICDTPSDKPLRLYYGRPGLSQDVLLFNFLVE